MAGGYLLLIAPEIDEPSKLWTYKPFEDMSIEEIINTAAECAFQGVDKPGYRMAEASHSPFEFTLRDAKQKILSNNQKDSLRTQTFFALINCEALDSTRFPEEVSTIVTAINL